MRKDPDVSIQEGTVNERLPFEMPPVASLPGETSPDSQLPDFCDSCPGCVTRCIMLPDPEEEDCFRLVSAMLEEIQFLEEEVVRWRQALIKYLEPGWADGLYDDIFSNLSGRFDDYPAYRKFVDQWCRGKDPYDSPEHTRTMLRLRDGNDETSITYL